MEEEKIITKIMHDNNLGYSITEIVLKTNLARSAVRICLARMEGAGRVKVRRIGMAKVYILNPQTSAINPIIENIAIQKNGQSNIKIQYKHNILLLYTILIILSIGLVSSEMCTDIWRPCIYDENSTLLECTSTNMSQMFEGIINWEAIGDITAWNTTCVTDMSGMFAGSDFNQDISNWDISSVTDMSTMFSEATYFDQPVGNWNTSSVMDMNTIFYYATSFNQDISTWNVESVNNMSAILMGATAFSIDNYDALLLSWSNQNVQNDIYFEANDVYYTPTGKIGRDILINNYSWSIFDGGITCDICSEICSPCGGGCTATDMTQMFYTTQYTPPDFDEVYGDITGWDTSCVTNMGMMFAGQKNFNQDISEWDTSQVTDMWRMFGSASAFNQNLSRWNTSSVTDMNLMFSGASSFDQPLGSWDITLVTDMENMFSEVTLSTENYDNLLNGWINTAPSGLTLSINSQYSASGLDARTYLIDNLSWTITDAGIETPSPCSEAWRPCIYDENMTLVECNSTDMTNMFDGVTDFDVTIGNITGWDVSCITSMNSIFKNSDFDQDISHWNISQVTDMSHMFENATAFNQDISSWNVSQVPDMSYMFAGATTFNQDIVEWDVSNVNNMAYMFENASSFDQNLGSWNISSVTDMSNMFLYVSLSTTNYDNLLLDWSNQSLQSDVNFHGGNSIYSSAGIMGRNILTGTYSWIITDGGQLTCSVCTELCSPCGGGCTSTDMTMMYADVTDWSATGNISGWDTSCITDMTYMFYNSNFNQDISTWNTSNVTNMIDMFGLATEFDQDISNWDVSQVNTMSYMFENAYSFNQNLSKWNISNAIDIGWMFSYATTFNQDISNWDVGSVMFMDGIFSYATTFNQDISNWDVSQVTTMSYMFENASSFNQNLGSWNTSAVTDMSYMFLDANLSATNYDNLLIGWSGIEQNPNIIFDAGNSLYSSAGLAGRNILITDHNWTITDSGYTTIAEIIPPHVDRSPSGSSSGSSGGGITYCKEDWKCSSWSPCLPEGVMNRACSDRNSCDTNKDKPTLTESCVFNNDTEKPKKKGKALFDIITEIVAEPKKVGEDLIVKISLINFGSSDQVDAELEYILSDYNNATVRQYTKVVPVTTQVEFLEYIDTKGLKEGKYSLNIKLTYVGQTEPASTEKIFYINKRAMSGLFGNKMLIAIVLSIIVMASLIFLYAKTKLKNKNET